jgi:serine/threonine protein kinase
VDRRNIVKLCDFGFAAFKESRNTVGGTAEYMAP